MTTAETTPGAVVNARTTMRKRRSTTTIREMPIHAFLFLCAAITVATTFGIVFVLFEETVHFFREVSIFDFLTDTQWTPLFTDKHFGVLPLLNATLLMALIAMLFALPLGLAIAIVSERIRAGAPTLHREANS